MGQKGFTLVELAIALMVIGLLIGGVLKGQELIKNAEIIRAINDINGLQTAQQIFESSYDALPGDIKNPGTRIPNCIDAICIISGNNDHNITNMRESGNYAYHLEKAGLITGRSVGISDYMSAETRYFKLMEELMWMSPEYPPRPNFNHYRIGVNISGTSIPKRFAEGIDMKLDDGKPKSGSIVARSVCITGASNDYKDWINISSCEMFLDIPGLANSRNGGPAL